MKSCPKCNRTFPDEGQKFCTFDGGLLIAPQTFDPNATIRAIAIDLNAAAERPTSRDLPDPNATIMENYPATVALPRNTGPTTGPTGTTPNTADISAAPPPAAPPQWPAPPPPPPPPVPPPPAPPTPAAEPPRVATGEIAAPTQAAVAPSAPLPAVAKKKSKLPLIIAGVLVFLLLAGGALAGLFFFVVKPKLDEMAQQRNPNLNRTPENTNVAVPTPSSTVEASTPAPTPEDNYVPPPGAIQFVNSKDKLDGVLAEHYFDFSFYYPKNWQTDPKAGVAGATNFVKVERRIPPDFTQENFVVRWYTSSGTLAGDLSSLPKKVEEFSNSLAKSFPEYRKVSEGPTKVNSLDAYEFKWEGLSKGTEKGDLHLWGRVIFLPTGKEGDTTGAVLSMFTTSLAPELSSVEDVGTQGEAPVILDSFRFGKK